MNSRAKGARGEREFAAFLRELGAEARRGQQYSGSPDSPDVVHNLPGLHFEVKRCERWEPEKWYLQAVRDAGPDEVPVVAMKKNRGRWLVLLDAEAFVRGLARSTPD